MSWVRVSRQIVSQVPQPFTCHQRSCTGSKRVRHLCQIGDPIFFGHGIRIRAIRLDRAAKGKLASLRGPQYGQGMFIMRSASYRAVVVPDSIT